MKTIVGTKLVATPQILYLIFLFLFLVNHTARAQDFCVEHAVFYLEEDERFLMDSDGLKNRNIRRTIYPRASIDNGIYKRHHSFYIEDLGIHEYELIDDKTGELCFGSISLERNCVANVCHNYVEIKHIAVTENEQFCIKISGKTVNGISSIQVPVSWDPNVIAFDYLSERGSIPRFLYNARDVEKGELRLLHVARKIPGHEPGYFDFELCFEAIGEIGASTAISFDQFNGNFPLAYTTLNYTGAPMHKIDGSISIVSQELCDENEQANCQISKVVVFPNPSSNVINFTIPQELIGSRMAIFNILGELEYEQTVKANISSVTVQELPTDGLKYIRINEQYFGKFVVNR